MKAYVKPVVLEAEELSEGIYTASGDTITTDCWTVRADSVQDWNGSHNVFEVALRHSNTVEHISAETVVNLTFNSALTDAYSEFPCSFSGSTATITRTLLADAYKSGDSVTYKVWAKAADEPTTKALRCVDATISCKHEVNVQGKYD